MKKIIFATILMLTLLACPSIARSGIGSTWVFMGGHVQTYGLDSAFGYCGVWAEVGNWAQVFAAWTPSKLMIPEIFNFYAAKLMNTSLVELNRTGADLYISGLWNVYNVTFIYPPGKAPGSYSQTTQLLVDHGRGILFVTGNWKAFTIDILGISEVVGTVAHYRIVSTRSIPAGDIWGPQGNPDNSINIWDLAHAAKAYGSTPGMPGMTYDFSMDLDFNFKIDIYDLTTIAVNIGKSY
jgi:hypothetical protein